MASVLTANALDNIISSGIEPEDILARHAGPTELASIGAQQSAEGYVIPYFDILGKPIAFYRVRLIDHDPKYKQPRGTENHIYFPPNFMQVLNEQLKKRKSNGLDASFIMLAEGERKAAKATCEGFPCVGVGGVENWRNRTLILPETTKLAANYGKHKAIKAKLPGGQNIGEIDSLAHGMQDLLNLIIANDLNLIITYDADVTGKVKEDVQRAAAKLGHELRYRGIPVHHIRQLILPNGEEKVGLDDYLNVHGSDSLKELIVNTLKLRTAFPRYPNLKAYVNRKLEGGKLTRKGIQELSFSILTELDARGRRLTDGATKKPYYFDEQTCKLMSVSLLNRHGEPQHESSFGTFLYKEYGIGTNDVRLITWLANQFTGEAPTETVHPKRIIAIPKGLGGHIAYQLNDSQFAVVTDNPDEPIRICSNGSHGILFEHDQVEPINVDALKSRLDTIADEPLEPWWREVFSNINVATGEDETSLEHIRTFIAMLFYISPWLNRWKGTQLPIELVTGEAGSGKSSLYSLRLSILTGRPLLRNAPHDVKDWHASITNCGALHVVDNVHFVNKELKQRISDEICRLTTEPDPHIELRQLYTTATPMRASVQTTFAMTAIQLPFNNVDLAQRSATFRLLRDSRHDGNWVEHRLGEFGGRTAWVAHHLWFLHKFLTLAKKEWNYNYAAKHRLAHYEQALMLAAKVFGIDASWLPDVLQAKTDAIVSEVDWALEGIREFAREWFVSYGTKETFSAGMIAEWAQMHDDYKGNYQLTDARKCGRYLQSHYYMLKQVCGIGSAGKKNNAIHYRVTKQK